MKLIGENLSSGLSSLPGYEAYYKEGDIGELRLYVSQPLSDETIEQLESEIISKGVYLTEPIAQDARVVIIKFKKTIAPLLIIAGAIAAIGVGLLGWQIFKLTALGVPIWAWIVGGGALLYLVLRKPVRKAAPYAIQAGKIYITRKVGGKR